MSRSYKKTVRWLGCDSEKVWKQLWHRKFRRIFNTKLHCGEDENFPSHVPMSDPWCSPSDGKIDWGDPTAFYDMNNPDDAEYVNRKYVKVGKKWCFRK